MIGLEQRAVVRNWRVEVRRATGPGGKLTRMGYNSSARWCIADYVILSCTYEIACTQLAFRVSGVRGKFRIVPDDPNRVW